MDPFNIARGNIVPSIQHQKNTKTRAESQTLCFEIMDSKGKQQRSIDRSQCMFRKYANNIWAVIKQENVRNKVLTRNQLLTTNAYQKAKQHQMCKKICILSINHITYFIAYYQSCAPFFSLLSSLWPLPSLPLLWWSVSYKNAFMRKLWDQLYIFFLLMMLIANDGSVGNVN